MTTLIGLFVLLAVASGLTVVVWFSLGKLRSALSAAGEQETAPHRARRAADAAFFSSSLAAGLAVLCAVFGAGALVSAPGSSMSVLLLITAVVALLGAAGVTQYYKLLGNRPEPTKEVK